MLNRFEFESFPDEEEVVEGEVVEEAIWREIDKIGLEEEEEEEEEEEDFSGSWPLGDHETDVAAIVNGRRPHLP